MIDDCRGFLLILLFTFSINQKSQAQEFNLDVRINTPALKTADPNTLKTLEKSIREFFNNNQWTDDEYDSDERIEGAIQINIKDDPSSNTFLADIYINTGRPIYSSNYTSPILNHVDKDVAFQYEELTPIRNNSTVFTDNLSSILTFYAYVILGFDYDSFSPSGGDQYFKIASSIISNVPPNVSNSDRSWTAIGGDRNRYWLMENILNPKVKKYRRAMYDYHRNSLDKMHKDAGAGKAIMMSALKEIGQVNDSYPNSMIMQMFANSKRAEILEIYKNSVKSEQRQVYKIMASIDATGADFLKELR